MHYDRRTLDDRRYWTSRLAGRRPRTGLWPDLRPLGERRTVPSTLAFRFPPPLQARLQAVTGGNDFLGCAVLLAGLQACLHRLTGGERPVVAVPSRRPAATANLLFVAGAVGAGTTFRELLSRAREALLEAHAHQGYRFERLLGDLGLALDGDRPPLTGVLIWHEALHLPPPPLAFDLALGFEVGPAGLAGTADFDVALFRRDTVERLLLQLERVLAAGLDRPELTVGALPLASAEERARLERWSVAADGDEADGDGGPPWLHEQVAAQASARRDAVALSWSGSWGEETLSFGELDRCVRRLARRLAALGVGPGAVVGVACERGLERVVSLLAVLAAGAAFLPLDPEYPEERLAFLLADSRAPILLATPAVRDRLAAIVPPGCRVVDPAGEEGDGRPPGPSPAVSLSGDDLAYVIYTSGSTGRPKGVQATHRGLANLARAQIRGFGVGAGSRVLQLAAFGFDAAVSEVAMALAAGARLDLGDGERMMPGPPLVGLLRERQVSHLTITPSALRELPLESLPALDTLVVAGEACGAELVRAWAPGRRFLDAYGPTEITVCATLGDCLAEEHPPGGPAPSIGVPMAGMRVRVLDRRLEAAPEGAPGELAIGGEGVARGYLGRPALTAERFVPDPFAGSGSTGERLYRSGDLGRFLPDGRLEFLGRIDRQVKLRGFRIEPGEIESALVACPEVHQAAVVIDARGAGQERLVAFFVSAAGSPAAEATAAQERLRAWLRERLPEHMVPAAFVPLAALPSTPNGKLDREALGAAAAAVDAGTDAGVPPRDVVELELTRLWEELLGRRPIGVRTSFFDLGGHSLLAMRLVTRVQEHFGVALPLAAVFEGPTIEELARRLRGREGRGRPWSPRVALDPRGDLAPLFCVHPAGGTVLCYRDLARQLGGERPFYGLQAQGLAEGQEPLEAMETVAATYLAAVRERQPEGPYYLAGWSFGGVAAFEMACQLRDQGEEVALLALFDAYAPDVLGESLRDRDDAEILSALMGGLLPVSADFLRRLEPEAQLHHLIGLARERELIPPDFDLAQAERLLRVSKTHYRVVETYRPRRFDRRLTLLRAEQERAFAASHTGDPTLGWGRWAAEVDLRFVPGTHQTMVQPPAVEGLAETLRACLELASSGDQAPALALATSTPSAASSAACELRRKK